ncbi:MAG: flagellar hook protein FlgE [Methylococcales bacterium]|nr:flagellar hook protein FlgE [Methylococcales bacterium]
MGFATALSGLNAASTSLQVIGNNIANANTTGFKESRAEFGDLYNTNSLSAISSTTPGAGVRVTEVAQQFHQGNIESTQNSLDIALSGNGFFALGEETDSTAVSAYTRNGAFQFDPEGYITNDSGFFLMGWPPISSNVDDGFNTGAATPIQIDTSLGSPSATTNIALNVNVDSREAIPPNAFVGYDPAVNAGPDVDSYNDATSVTLFDSLGNTHTLTSYFVNTTVVPGATSTWDAYLYLDGHSISTPGTLNNAPGTLVGNAIPMVFDTFGNLIAADTGTVTGAGTGDDFVITGLDISALGVIVEPLTFSIDPTGSTQNASSFSVNNLQQDGFAAGNLTGINIDEDGIVFARFSNGTSSPLGQIILGRFTNNQGLEKIGDTTWRETISSGTVVLGVAGTNNFGEIQSASLEASNTDIATQLVRLIVAQQTYQANAKTISTEDEIIQTIINI